MPAVNHTKIYKDVEPLSNGILIVELEKGVRRTIGGIIINDNNGKLSGIHPRWAKVYKVGSKIKNIREGQYILLEHGMWSYGIDMILEEGEEYYLHKANPKGILLVSDTEPCSTDIQKGKD